MADRPRVQVHFTLPSRTKQSFKEECDINNIMKKFEKTGLLTHVRQYGGDYADVSQGIDYQDALNCVMNANDAFMSLPASVRLKFENDPGRFLEFVTNSANADDMVKMGLANAPAVAAVVRESAVVADSDKPAKK